MATYIAYAYRVKNYEISGPDWMASERFDITAKLPAGRSAKDAIEMLRALLEERFQLKTHRESKELPAYALVVGKGGLKMQESATEPGAPTTNEARPGFHSSAVPRPGGVTVDLGNGSSYTFADNKLEGRKKEAREHSARAVSVPGPAGGGHDEPQRQIRFRTRIVAGRFSGHGNPGGDCGWCRAAAASGPVGGVCIPGFTVQCD
ncbi:MAG TPA: TIGR03435 family protein [Bryobacteraceae bacterium]|nr:TIGR03435 family protein [Bryobacteraceae bacterium]